MGGRGAQGPEVFGFPGGVARNRMEDRIEVRQGDARDFLSEPADLLLANLTYNLLGDLVLRPEIREKPRCILSGLVGGQAHGLKERMASTPMEVTEVRCENGWFSVLTRSAVS